MAETTNYQCPNCGGALRYDGRLGKLCCDFCDSTFTVAEVERFYAERQQAADAQAQAGAQREEQAQAAAAQQEAQQRPTSEGAQHAPVEQDPIQAYLHYSKLDDEARLRAYSCSSCGAQLMVDEATAVTSCPYCGNNAVLPGQLSDVLKPDYVIPFVKSREEAVAALHEYYQGKRLLPDAFTDENHLEEVQGVYVPFWLYTGNASGRMVFAGEKVMTWEDRDNVYTKTDHYRIVRGGSLPFSRVPVDGSVRMPDAHMDAIEPYDYAALQEFSVAYLPGYVTDRYDLNAEECEERADARVRQSYLNTLMDTVTGFGAVRLEEDDSCIAWSNVSYALLPVWMLHTRWNGKDYLFAMNGQTGKLIGDLPIDMGKQVRNFLAVFVPLLVAAVLVVTFFVGGYRM